MNYEDFCPLTDLDYLNETLDKYGVAVLPDVFTSDECDNYKKQIFRVLDQDYDVREPDDFEDKLKPLRGCMLGSYGVSLMRPVLDLKTEEKAIEPFRKIWNENELTTSLDRITIFPPPEQTRSKRFFSPNDLWFHADQASHKLDKCCIQSFVVLEPIEHGDGCLSVLLGSHTHFTQFVDHFRINTKGRDWMRIDVHNQFQWYVQRGCQWKMIMAPKGSMVFWDSRTIHMGTAPRSDRLVKDRYRFIVYTCFTPAKWQTAENRKTLRKAYIQNRSTNHWPYGEIILNSKPEDDTTENDLRSLSLKHKKYLGFL